MTARFWCIFLIGLISCALPEVRPSVSPVEVYGGRRARPVEIRLLSRKEEGAFLKNAGYSLLTLGALTRISAQGTYSWEIRSGDCRQRIHTDREDGLYGVFMPPVGLIATALGSAIYSLPEWPENLYCRGEGMLQCYDADSLPVDWPWQKEAISALKECPW